MKNFVKNLVLISGIFLWGYDGFEALKEFKGNDGDIAIVLVDEVLRDFSVKEHKYIYVFVNDKWILHGVGTASKVDTIPLGGGCHK